MQIADHHRRGPVGLALAGGGPEGAIYEIGVLRALDDALDGLDLNDVPVTVGVSAGAFVGASLANGITTAQLARSVIGNEPGEHPFRPELFLAPAFGEYMRRAVSVPGLALDAVVSALRHPTATSGLVSTLIDRLGRAVPVGVFDNGPLREYLEMVYSRPGRTDDFRKLKNELYVVATDLDASTSVRFGAPGRDDVPISLAVQASTALPGLYPPVEIDGRHYVDGVLNKTVHASVAFDRGARLVIAVNPIVPVDTEHAVAAGAMRDGRLVDRGMPGVMAQTFRTLIHSRMASGMAAYRERYEGADLVLFEPRRDDYTMFFTNVFSFAAREEVIAHAYRSTLLQLRDRQDEVGPLFERHGIHLREDVISQPRPDLWESVGLRGGARRLLPSTVATRDLRDALSDLGEILGPETAP
ncbi:MAG TPA: patatin-like phospholipase family protein [Rubricoccaceae bacterium]|jgi:predicted acylesterase/phospholipase RssA